MRSDWSRRSAALAGSATWQVQRRATSTSLPSGPGTEEISNPVPRHRSQSAIAAKDASGHVFVESGAQGPEGEAQVFGGGTRVDLDGLGDEVDRARREHRRG